MNFPVILIDNKDEYFELLKDGELFLETNFMALKKQTLLDSYIIDSFGYKYIIESVKKVKNINPFWKFEFFNPLIQVKIDVEKGKSKVHFKEFKHKLIRILKKDPFFWDSGGRLKEKIDIINQSISINEIINLLNEEEI